MFFVSSHTGSCLTPPPPPSATAIHSLESAASSSPFPQAAASIICGPSAPTLFLLIWSLLPKNFVLNQWIICCYIALFMMENSLFRRLIGFINQLLTVDGPFLAWSVENRDDSSNTGQSIPRVFCRWIQYVKWFPFFIAMTAHIWRIPEASWHVNVVHAHIHGFDAYDKLSCKYKGQACVDLIERVQVVIDT
jgi:hypothetical protein